MVRGEHSSVLENTALFVLPLCFFVISLKGTELITQNDVKKARRTKYFLNERLPAISVIRVEEKVERAEKCCTYFNNHILSCWLLYTCPTIRKVESLLD